MQGQHPASWFRIGDALDGMGGPVKVDPQRHAPGWCITSPAWIMRTSWFRPSMRIAIIGFMARLLALCSTAPHQPRNPERVQARQRNLHALHDRILGDNKLPFGNFPRLLMAWVSTEAVRTQSRVLILGQSLAKFMKTLRVYSSGGGCEQIKFRNEVKRLLKQGELSSCSTSDQHRRFHGQRRDRPPHRVLVERAPGRSVLTLGQQDRTAARTVFNEISQPSGAARHGRHPNSPASDVQLGPRSLPLAGLPHLAASRSAAPHLAAGVPSVKAWIRDNASAKQTVKNLHHKVLREFQKIKLNLEGLELLNGSAKRTDPASLGFHDRAERSRPANKLICPAPTSRQPERGLCRVSRRPDTRYGDDLMVDFDNKLHLRSTLLALVVGSGSRPNAVPGETSRGKAASWF